MSDAAHGADDVLAELERWLLREGSHAILCTTPGPETDLLTVALAGRLAQHLEVARIAAHRMGEDEFFARVLERLGRVPSAGPEAQLLRYAQSRAHRGSAIVLLVRGADTLPGDLLRRLGSLAAASERGLRLALVVESDAPDDPAPRLTDVLGVGAQTLRVGPARARALTGLIEAAPLRGRIRRRERADDHRPASRRPPRRLPGLRRLASATAGSAAIGLLAVVVQTPDWAALTRDVSAPPRPAAWVAGIAEAASPPDREPEIPEVRPAEPPEAHSIPTAPATSTAVVSPTPIAPGASTANEEPEPAPAVEPSTVEPQVVLAVASDTRVASDTGAASDAGAAEEPAPPPTARVSLNARPWARVEVDGRELGVTPLGELPIPTGRHRFRAFLPDGRVVERSLQVGPGELYLSFP